MVCNDFYHKYMNDLNHNNKMIHKMNYKEEIQETAVTHEMRTKIWPL